MRPDQGGKAMAARMHVLCAHPTTGMRGAPRGATPQLPSVVSCATTALIIAILALTWPAVLARATQIPHDAVPRIYGYPALYRYQHTQWQRTAVLRPGDLARFTLLFRLPALGWRFPS